MENIVKEYLNIHSTSYVINTYNNGLINEYCFGYRTVLPNKKKVNRNTLYDIASLTKVFVSTLTYIFYEEGKIDINKTIYELNNKFVNLKDVTLLDLLSHRVELWTDGYLGDSKTKEEFLNKIYTSSVKTYLPTYVDAHYIVISVLLEEMFNKSLSDLLEEKIFKKLNLKNTTFHPKGSNIASCSFEHQKDKIIDNIEVGKVHDTKARIASNLGLYTGHAGIFTTSNDFMKFLVSFLDNTLLKKETIEFMVSHKDINKENFDRLKEVTKEQRDINIMYDECLLNDIDVHISRPINNMGTRFRSAIIKKNDVPFNASSNTITFSGFSGPIFTLDFDKKIIIVIMSNAIHNSSLDRLTRKCLSDDLMNEIYDYTIKES